MSGRYGEPVADSASVQRYGADRAAEFARIKGAQAALMAAFDSLAKECVDIGDAAGAAWAFDYFWSLADERRQATLAQPKDTPEATP